ncbi:MAG: hypothetical protein NVSMB47_16940 [Polyangiales bacterium]
MKHTTHALLAAIVVLGSVTVVGCKSDEDKLVSYLEDEADIIDKNKDDCDKMGDKLKSWADSNSDDMKKLQKKMEEKEKGMSADDKKKVEEDMKKKYGDRLDKAMEKILGGALKCATNDKVKKAMEATK